LLYCILEHFKQRFRANSLELFEYRTIEYSEKNAQVPRNLIDFDSKRSYSVMANYTIF
jgi:hypothetical protein